MTEQEFLALEPREQRELMGIQVMGWHRGDDTNWYDGFGGFQTAYFDPLKDIAPAWQVVEKMREEGWLVLVVGGHDGNMCACLMVARFAAPIPVMDVVTSEIYMSGAIRVQSKTAPLAICIAALKAKGVIE